MVCLRNIFWWKFEVEKKREGKTELAKFNNYYNQKKLRILRLELTYRKIPEIIQNWLDFNSQNNQDEKCDFQEEIKCIYSRNFSFLTCIYTI